MPPPLGWMTGLNCFMLVTVSAMPQRSICKVLEKNIQPFSRNSGTYRETEKHTN